MEFLGGKIQSLQPFQNPSSRSENGLCFLPPKPSTDHWHYQLQGHSLLGKYLHAESTKDLEKTENFPSSQFTVHPFRHSEPWGAWLVRLVEHAKPDRGVVSSSPTFSVELT